MRRRLPAALAELAFFLVALASLAGCSSSTEKETEECFYATTCRKGDCSGPVTKSGCNVKCGPGEVEELSCFRDSGSDAADARDGD